MRVTKNKTKNGLSFYIIRSVDGGSTEVVEKLGTEKEIMEKYHCKDAEAWARERARKLTENEKESREKVLVPFRPHVLLDMDQKQSFQIGYLFLQQIYYDLKLPLICNAIAKRHAFQYDMNEILSRLVYGRILFPSSKLSTYKQSSSLFEKSSFSYHDIPRALSVIAEEYDFIQERLYKYSSEVIPRKTSVLYYDCTNFYFEIEEESGLRRYGKSKENRPNPIVQMGLFMDYSGLPLAMTITNGNENEQKTLLPLEKKILSDFELSNFVVCTDAGLSSESNRKFNNFGERFFVTTQSIRKMTKERQDWCLNPKGWKLPGSDILYDLNSLEVTEADRIRNYDKVFYKEICLEGYDEERDIEYNQTLFVTYSLKYRDYLRRVREGQLDRARKLVNQGKGKIERSGAHDVRRFIKRSVINESGEEITRTDYSINEDVITEESKFDGFYAVCTNLEADVEEIIRVNKGRWEIEESFRIMKDDFDARPVYVQRDDRIKAHFMTCFISLLIFRILEKKLGSSYTASDILSTLREMKVTRAGDTGYLPSYIRTHLTDSLHETAGFRTDYEILKKRAMQGVIRRSKGL